MKSLLYLSQLLDSNWAPPCNICQNNSQGAIRSGEILIIFAPTDRNPIHAKFPDLNGRSFNNLIDYGGSNNCAKGSRRINPKTRA